MRLQKKIIAVYAEGAVSTGSLLHRLKQTFNSRTFDIRQVTAQDIENGVLDKNARALFMPGVQDDSRTYREKLTSGACEKIRSYIENGGTYVGLCAGAYLAATKFQYTNQQTGEVKNIESPLALFDGQAFGPIREYTKGGDDTHQWNNHAVARLAFNNAATNEEGRACYALGPWLELSESAKNDGDHTVIARYADIPGTPIAIARRIIGKGKAVFCGVLPEISGADMPQTSERFAPACKNIRAGLNFARELATHEPARRHAWKILIAEIG